jgi:hypothetical protein
MTDEAVEAVTPRDPKHDPNKAQPDPDADNENESEEDEKEEDDE